MAVQCQNSGSSSQLGEQEPHFCEQNCKLRFDDLPDDVVVDAVITVGDDIAETDDPAVFADVCGNSGIENFQAPDGFA